MPFCTSCGEKLGDDTRFCPSCGQKVAADFSQPLKSAPPPAQPAADVKVCKCPNCTKNLAETDKKCPACGSPVFVKFEEAATLPPPVLNKYVRSYTEALSSHPDDAEINLAIGSCFLNLKLYDKAAAAFEKAFADSFDNPEPFFYAAVAALGGKKPFLHTRDTINRILENVNAAISIEERGIFRYFLAYVKYDYFERKYFNISPNWRAELSRARALGFSAQERDAVFNCAGLGVPPELQ